MKRFKQPIWKTVFFVWLSVFGLITGVQLVEENLDGRSRAERILEVSCGATNGLELDSRPVDDLCNRGEVIWIDLTANDGDYNWECVEGENSERVECSAFLKN
jgi:hypothetical protein